MTAGMMVTCPLCWRPGFTCADSLCSALVDIQTRRLACPICPELIYGIDKYTIHLFSHILNKGKEEAEKKVATVTKAVEMKPPTPPKYDNIPPLVPSSTPIATPVTVTPALLSSGGLSAGAVVYLRADTGQMVAIAQDSLRTVTINTQNFITNTSVTASESPSRDTGQEKRPKDSEPSGSGSNKDEFQSCKDLITRGDFTVDESASTIAQGNKEASADWTCGECRGTFSSRGLLAVHAQLAHRSKMQNQARLQCPSCPNAYNMRGSLLLHQRVAHSEPPQTSSNNPDTSESPKDNTPKPACSVCGKFFKKEIHLLQHMKAHDAKQWQCAVCSKTFSTKYFLKKHRRLHTGETPFKCSKCGKAFTFEQSYRKHMAYHSDCRPYQCSACHKSFRQLSTLHNHERIHSGEKPFPCDICGKSFRQRVSYLVHKRIHTGVMPYKCTACHKTFRYKVSGRSHRCECDPPGTVIRTHTTLVERLTAAFNKAAEAIEKKSQESVVSSVSSPTLGTGSHLMNTPPPSLSNANHFGVTSSPAVTSSIASPGGALSSVVSSLNSPSLGSPTPCTNESNDQRVIDEMLAELQRLDTPPLSHQTSLFGEAFSADPLLDNINDEALKQLLLMPFGPSSDISMS